METTPSKIYLVYEPLGCEGGGADIIKAFLKEAHAIKYVEKYKRENAPSDVTYEEIELEK